MIYTVRLSVITVTTAMSVFMNNSELIMVGKASSVT